MHDDATPSRVWRASGRGSASTEKSAHFTLDEPTLTASTADAIVVTVSHDSAGHLNVAFSVVSG